MTKTNVNERILSLLERNPPLSQKKQMEGKPNWANQTIWTGDNLEIMRGMNSESVDLIYLDPPFNSNANYAAPIGSKAAGAEFKDTWTLDDIEVEWIKLIKEKHLELYRFLIAAMTDSDKAYLCYMSIRILEMRRLLKPTGSIYLHCDQTMSHFLKLIMDSIFGKKQYKNELVWWYYNVAVTTKRTFGRKHDSIFLYTKGKSWTFNADAVRIPYSKNSNWVKNSESYKDNRYKPNPNGKLSSDVLTIPTINNMSKERTKYPTQKPLSLLKILILASSNPGDMVLDPFCGCATTCVAADELQRQWVGIDISPKAAELVKARIKEKLPGMLYEGVHRTDLPKRTDLGKLLPANHPSNKKFLYGEQGGDCAGCNDHFKIQHLEVDHIIPKSKSGTDHIENLQLLCSHCNKIKNNRSMAYLKMRLKILRGEI